MTLEEMDTKLREVENKDKKILLENFKKLGGSYSAHKIFPEELCFEYRTPKNTEKIETVRDLMKFLNFVHNKTMHCYQGGVNTITEETDVWVGNKWKTENSFRIHDIEESEDYVFINLA